MDTLHKISEVHLAMLCEKVQTFSSESHGEDVLSFCKFSSTYLYLLLLIYCLLYTGKLHMVPVSVQLHAPVQDGFTKSNELDISLDRNLHYNYNFNYACRRRTKSTVKFNVNQVCIYICSCTSDNILLHHEHARK